MYTVLKRGWRARPGWVLALAIVLALHYVCIVCMAAAASAEAHQVRTDALAGKAIVAEAAAEPAADAAASAGASEAAEVPPEELIKAGVLPVLADGDGGVGGASALAPDSAHDYECDAPIINTSAFFGADTDDSGVKSPADHRTASTALLVMLLLSVALAVALRLPPLWRGPVRTAVAPAVWRPSGIRLLTTLCIQRV
ncbi:hypothetical protein O4J56_17860 [Nocardiopsis sp. RSe5-2]|uniref:Uncharacterized protein n=1 Tax=Nocardiopsis endophytica TaxID=3018445 RepID=A0ABT4U6E1_9ACTN|nr:hypothetical protein [Nocardiopsis endophytica]MDA2812514.1 hypothetical protein [Nocardiopsis endophytica]